MFFKAQPYASDLSSERLSYVQLLGSPLRFLCPLQESVMTLFWL